MALDRVDITGEAFLTCLMHALSTEAEEVMGLLLGYVQDEGGLKVARIFSAVPQIRTDRRKDRVESSPEQMAECTALADAMGASSGLRVRVMGWYHSHPHITVLPSHIDVATQALYQRLDPWFVGLIVSCFNRDTASLAEDLRVTAFQADCGAMAAQGDAGPSTSPARRALRREVPLRVAPSSGPMERALLRDAVRVPRTLLEEEQQHARRARDEARQNAVQRLHAAGAHAQSLCALLDTTLAPTLAAMRARIRQNAALTQQLAAQASLLA